MVGSNQLQGVIIPKNHMELLVVNSFQEFVLLVIVFPPNFTSRHIHIFFVAEDHHLFFETHSIVDVELAGLDSLG